MNPYYLYSYYENDDLNKEVKVYGFKNTLDKDVGNVDANCGIGIEYIDNNASSLIIAKQVQLEVKKSFHEGDKQDQRTLGSESNQDSLVNETKEPHVENDLIHTENTQNQKATQTNERENNDADQEESKRTIERNNHGKVLAIVQNRFSIETEDGPKWFVGESAETIKEIKPNMAISVYFTEHNAENKLSQFFITFTPDEGDQTEFIDAHFLHYAGESNSAIVVYTPPQEVIFDLSNTLQNHDLSAEYTKGQVITIGIVTQIDGTIIIESITPSIKEEQLANL